MGRSDQAAYAELKNHHKAWLSSLEERAEVEGLLLCHGTPDSDTTYLPRPSSRMAACGSRRTPRSTRRLAGVQAPIVLCGHSHMCARRRRSMTGGWWSIPAASGLPAYTDTEPVKHSMEMGAPHARYAVLERKKAADPWQVSFRVVAYDWDGAAASAAEERPRGLGALDQDGVRELARAARLQNPHHPAQSRAASRAAAASRPRGPRD